MNTPLNASATTAGTLFSKTQFVIPPYQREYSWSSDEVSEFWNDLQHNISSDSYFLGLIILTEESNKKHVVDGQQRILTLTLLSIALYKISQKHSRNALAARIKSDFLYAIDFETDETLPRVTLSDTDDNSMLKSLLNDDFEEDKEIQSPSLILKSYNLLYSKLKDDLKEDPFKKLGLWAEFITNKLYFAVFVHPDASEAYQVFEVINTRGAELTTADLLKNYVLSQTPKKLRDDRYQEWQKISKSFLALGQNGSNIFVQYIRHVVTIEAGHILPKDLFSFLANRTSSTKTAPSAEELVQKLKVNLPLYLQMVDPSTIGPAEQLALDIFGALNILQVIAVRPLLLAIFKKNNALNGMKYILQLVVRRIIVGNLGTGNVERKFGEAAKSIHESDNWEVIIPILNELNPKIDEFKQQLIRRSYNKGTLTFIRNSIIQNTLTPKITGTLHFFVTKTQEIGDFSQEDVSYWSGTLPNTYLSSLDKHPPQTNTWQEIKENLITNGVEHEIKSNLLAIDTLNSAEMGKIGEILAERACHVWYD